jgi:(1->4)-alpha-D-glucan 1-alpha-D-glucosylmutase
MTRPRATYRLQFHAGFTFADAQAIVPYLADLGISHVYASPITTAVPGSIHGYDMVDPARINPELGGEAGFAALVAALRASGMGLILDIVPNHMGVAGDANRWWLDVLQRGPASEYAACFDIDWTGPLLPVLAAPLDQVLAAGDLRLAERDGRKGLELYGSSFYPLRRDGAGGSGSLEALLDAQHYRLIYWREANDRLNWRRFFAINDLAGLRIEDPAVFARIHALPLDLWRRGLIDGLRIDHVDGLADPAAYCRRLRAAMEEAGTERSAYIIVEKILAPGEHLPDDWGVDGTSGYDFMREVTALLHDPAGEAPLRDLWARISGRSGDFAAEVLIGRRDMLAWQFDGQLGRCVHHFAVLARSAGQGWIPEAMLRRAVERLLWVFPVYRTYGPDAPAGDADVREAARRAVAPHLPPGESGIVELVLDWLAGQGAGDAALRREAVRRFQQLAAPIAAKGVEDTAFYRHGALLSANDVGFDPARMTMDVAAFHAAMQRRAGDYPGALLATGTHDHKRGEDARARLAVLSAVPEAWSAAVDRWLAQTAPIARGIAPGDIAMLFQTMIGAWEVGPGEGDPAELLPRLQAWQRKALREARLRSSWEAPDEAYEALCLAFGAALLTGEDNGFRADFTDFMAALAPAAAANSLAQAALHCLAPGVPDFYQGAELADYSMVDPDNRRPIDFARCRALLAAPDASLDGAKIAAIARLLSLPVWGEYRALGVTGPRRGRIVAFTRGTGDGRLHCAVAIRLGCALFGGDRAMPEAEWWGDTQIEGGRLAREIFALQPFAVWSG